MRSIATIPGPTGRSQRVGWLVTIAFLIGVNLPAAVPVDLFALSAPLLPTEEEDPSPASHGAVISEDAATSRNPEHRRFVQRRPVSLHAHTPTPGVRGSQFRQPVDHFRNGLGTPFRC